MGKEESLVSIRCVIIGDAGIGKTCLLIVHCMKAFPTDYVPTVFDNYSTHESVMCNDEKYTVNLQFWDTHMDQEYFFRYTQVQTDVFLLCFSIVSRESFDAISFKWAPYVTSHWPDAVKILVGTKRNLRNDEASPYVSSFLTQKPFKPVTIEEGVQKAMDIGAASYCETSALKNEGVGDTFNEAVQAVLTSKYAKKKKEMCVIM